MFSEATVRVVSLDTESRVRGICQLMEGVILTIRIGEADLGGKAAPIIRQFEFALRSLDKYALMADLLLDKHRRLKKINNDELKKHRRTIIAKRKEVTEILRREYDALGLPEFADFGSMMKL